MIRRQREDEICEKMNPRNAEEGLAGARRCLAKARVRGSLYKSAPKSKKNIKDLERGWRYLENVPELCDWIITNHSTQPIPKTLREAIMGILRERDRVMNMYYCSVLK